MSFIDIVASGSVGDFDNLAEFEDDERLEDVDFRALVFAVCLWYDEWTDSD